LSQIAFSQSHCLDRLVDRAGSDGLDFGVLMFPHHTGNRAGDSRSSGSSFDFDNVHGWLPPVERAEEMHFDWREPDWQPCLKTCADSTRLLAGTQGQICFSKTA
jgi:hypothetical protein